MRCCQEEQVDLGKGLTGTRPPFSFAMLNHIIRKTLKKYCLGNTEGLLFLPTILSRIVGSEISGSALGKKSSSLMA